MFLYGVSKRQINLSLGSLAALFGFVRTMVPDLFHLIVKYNSLLLLIRCFLLNWLFPLGLGLTFCENFLFISIICFACYSWKDFGVCSLMKALNRIIFIMYRG